MTKIHIIREGKPVVEISFHRTPGDGSEPNGQVNLQTSLRSHEQLAAALSSALIRLVDEVGPAGPEVVIELGSDSYEN